MTENSEPTPFVTIQELTELIESFEQYRERLLNETITTAQKAKLSQKMALAKIEPELSKIEDTLLDLRTQQAALATKN